MGIDNENAYMSGKSCFLYAVYGWREYKKSHVLAVINKALALASQRGFTQSEKFRTLINDDNATQEEVQPIVDDIFHYIDGVEFVRDCVGASR